MLREACCELLLNRYQLLWHAIDHPNPFSHKHLDLVKKLPIFRLGWMRYRHDAFRRLRPRLHHHDTLWLPPYDGVLYPL